MKNWILSAVLVLGVAILSSCDEETLGFGLEEIFTLSYGEERTQEDGSLNVKFADVLEDSRCPQGAECIWEGQAIVKLTLSGSVNESIELTARGGDGALAKDTVNDLVFTLLNVTPYPTLNDTIRKEEYKIELQVDSL